VRAALDAIAREVPDAVPPALAGSRG